MLFDRHHPAQSARSSNLHVLFVLKYRSTPYGGESNTPWGAEADRPLHSGLFNSARLVRDMLDHNGVESRLVHVVDNNAIHRAIAAFGATHVVIEAFWVAPEKFAVLRQACPGVKFIIRNHSETPFLANEGMAFDWTLAYALQPEVAISCNAPRMLSETRFLVAAHQPELDEPEVVEKVPYLPNFYPTPDGDTHRPLRSRPSLEIGCLGAIRPLKNHMVQAIAALSFAEEMGKPLNFHVNGTRIEGAGGPILKNLRQMFARFPRHNLVEHPWLDHDAFRELVASMDYMMQVSFSETFNIVAADAVTQGIPTVTSHEIPWAAEPFLADPNSSADICRALRAAHRMKLVMPRFNPSLQGLRAYNARSRETWLSYFGAHAGD